MEDLNNFVHESKNLKQTNTKECFISVGLRIKQTRSVQNIFPIKSTCRI